MSVETFVTETVNDFETDSVFTITLSKFNVDGLGDNGPTVVSAGGGATSAELQEMFNVINTSKPSKNLKFECFIVCV